MLLKDEASVLKLLASNEEILLASLAKLEGKSEWGVRITRSENSRGPAKRPACRQNAGSGKEYLLRKQHELHLRQKSNQEALSYAEACHKKLQEVAAMATLLSSDYGRSVDSQTLLNAAYLVAGTQAKAFQRCVTALAKKYSALGITLHFTSPWPAYSFTDLPLGSAGVSSR